MGENRKIDSGFSRYFNIMNECYLNSYSNESFIGLQKEDNMVQNNNFYVSQSEFWNYFYKHRNAKKNPGCGGVGQYVTLSGICKCCIY